MYNAMKILIRRRFYASAEAAKDKLNVFYAFNQLTDEQYTELMVLVEEMYPAAEE